MGRSSQEQDLQDRCLNEERASCLHGERLSGQREGRSFLCKGKRRRQTLRGSWARTSPKSPAVPTCGKCPCQESSGLRFGAVARWLPCHLVIVAGRMFLSPQCSKYLASGSVQLDIQVPAVIIIHHGAKTPCRCSVQGDSHSLFAHNHGWTEAWPCRNPVCGPSPVHSHGSWVAKVPECL